MSAAVITERETRVLEFDRIREELMALVISPMAAEKAAALQPSSDHALVERLQGETSEGRAISVGRAYAPSPVADVGPLVARAEKGACLSGEDLLSLLTFTKAARSWVEYFGNEERTLLYPLLYEKASLIEPCAALTRALEKTMDSEGNLLDGASPALSSLRRRKMALQGRIRDKLDEYLRGSHFRRYLQEALVTIRNGRYVLPVKQEYRQSVQGVVHDQSASGATLFVEPLPVVQMQNDLKTLGRQEEREIERIFLELSGKVAEISGQIMANRELYGELDFIVARGLLSLRHGGMEPVLDAGGTPFSIALDQAVHPLLTGKKVPLDVVLGAEARTLVITGPNTGGKTVALKTIGLLAIMAQCGLHLPAGKKTRLSVFRQVRSDIGDEQSINQSLSTFSGHMSNIIGIIREAGPGSLALFDELGAGTDPSEGSALAMAILEELTAGGAVTVATTHINELKLFAQVQDGMQNAAMEFDLETLEPTYRLLQGIPGQSNAFYIADHLGLPEKVLQKARGFIHRAHDQVESVIARLVEDQQRFQRDSRQAALERNRAEFALGEIEKERRLVQARREDILKEAREEAQQLVRKARLEVEEMIRQIRRAKSEGGAGAEAKAEVIRRELNALRRETGPEREEPPGEKLVPADAVEGLTVFIPTLNQRGEIVSCSGGEAVVQVGPMKANLPLSELRKAAGGGGDKDAAGSSRGGGYTVQKDLGISTSIDLRGLNIEEAIPEVDKHLDNALWAGLNKVELLHGKGTGKLKEGLRSYLREHYLVGSIHSAPAARGGDGVTVVELKT